MPERYELVLFADHHQIHVADEDYTTDAGDLWTDDAVARLLAIGPDLVAIGTARDTETPLWLELHTARPPVDLEGWSQVAECSIATPSRRIVVMGCSDFQPSAFTLGVPGATMCMRISWGGLDRVSQGAFEGDDRYVVQMWPGEPEGTAFLKERGAGG